MKKTIIGIILFLLQISLALFYNNTFDLKFIFGLALIATFYLVYKLIKKKEDII